MSKLNPTLTSQIRKQTPAPPNTEDKRLTRKQHQQQQLQEEQKEDKMLTRGKRKQKDDLGSSVGSNDDVEITSSGRKLRDSTQGRIEFSTTW
jgi:hypothetical protein